MNLKDLRLSSGEHFPPAVLKGQPTKALKHFERNRLDLNGEASNTLSPNHRLRGRCREGSRVVCQSKCAFAFCRILQGSSDAFKQKADGKRPREDATHEGQESKGVSSETAGSCSSQCLTARLPGYLLWLCVLSIHKEFSFSLESSGALASQPRRGGQRRPRQRKQPSLWSENPPFMHASCSTIFFSKSHRRQNGAAGPHSRPRTAT